MALTNVFDPSRYVFDNRSGSLELLSYLEVLKKLKIWIIMSMQMVCSYYGRLRPEYTEKSSKHGKILNCTRSVSIYTLKVMFPSKTS